jgi:hypothetical protein
MSIDISGLKANGHLHTPYSFSSFTSVEQIFQLAKAENISIVGVNDFFTFDGYNEFNQFAKKSKLYPMFGIEFIGLEKQMQQSGVLINDPANPGRIYISGKGIKYPVNENSNYFKKITKLQDQSNAQSQLMIEKLNIFLQSIGIKKTFLFAEIQKQFAHKQVRERHIAKALREWVFEYAATNDERKKTFVQLFQGKDLNSDLENISAVENEIRDRILKKGGVAFVEESDENFLPLDEIKNLIIEAGGIPCYPILLDFKDGQFTGFEKNYEEMSIQLIEWGIGCIELIPQRNELKYLEGLVKFFNERNFVITFGTEHNTPSMSPLSINAKGNQNLTPELQRISNEGCAIIAAHQELVNNEKEGFLDEEGNPKNHQYKAFLEMGKEVLNNYLTL